MRILNQLAAELLTYRAVDVAFTKEGEEYVKKQPDNWNGSKYNGHLKVVEIVTPKKGKTPLVKLSGGALIAPELIELPVKFDRVNSDLYGNPRYVCHYLEFITEKELRSYDWAIIRARRLGGKKYSTKKYAGGIVFQTYNTDELSKAINRMMREAEKEQAVTK